MTKEINAEQADIVTNLDEKKLHAEREREMIRRLQEHIEKMKEVNRQKDEFSAMISHELKSPLIPIVGYSELLLDGTFGDLNAVQLEKLGVIHQSALRLTQMINDILDINKLELNKMNLHKLETSLESLVKESVDALRCVADAKKVKLVSQVEQGLILLCDAKRIHQVLSNLINNSLKFVADGTGEIEVLARRELAHVIFTVKDNGIGIPQEQQAKLFQKFYQVDTSLGRKVGGSGLGLVIAKGIVEAHHGKIWIQSEPCRGSTFHFTIPMSGLQDVK